MDQKYLEVKESFRDTWKEIFPAIRDALEKEGNDLLDAIPEGAASENQVVGIMDDLGDVVQEGIKAINRASDFRVDALVILIPAYVCFHLCLSYIVEKREERKETHGRN